MLTKISSIIFYLGQDKPKQALVDLAHDQRLSLEAFHSSDELVSRLNFFDHESDKIVIVVDKSLDSNNSESLCDIVKLLNPNRSIILMKCNDSNKDFLKNLDCHHLVQVQENSFEKDSLSTIESFFNGKHSDEVVLDGNLLSGLTCKQKALIRLFLSSEEREVERHAILENVWGDLSIQPKTVDVHLYNLRRKIHPYGYLIRSEGGGRWKLLSERIDQNDS